MLFIVLFLILGIVPNGYSQTPVSGTITADTTWTLAGSPYQVTGSVTVAQGVTLTIDVGVRVEFNQSEALWVYGALKAVGTSAQPIRFTGSTEGASGFWHGIYVPGGGSADLEHCSIAYAGSSIWADSAYRYAGLYKSGSGALILKNTTLAHSLGAGLQLEGTTGIFTSADNTFSNNGQGIRVAINTSFQHDDTSTFTGNTHDLYLNGGTMTGAVSWYLNPAYTMYLSDHITVNVGAVLQVLPGTVVKAAQHKALFILGTLEARGEAAEPIVFTDWRDDTRGGDANGDGDKTVPGPGWWGGIYVPGGGSADMKHGTIAYAGDSTWADSAYRFAGFYKSGSGALTIENTRLAHSLGAGLQLEGTTGIFTSADNTFSNNGQGIRVAINTSFQHDDTSTFTGNTHDVYLNGGTMTGAVSWYLNPAYTMYLSDHITVNVGAVLQVLPGTVVKAAQHKSLFILGTLEARGEAAKPIVFTDWRDDTRGGDANGDGDETVPGPGWWGGIYVPGSGSADMKHGTIAYAGDSTWADSAYRYAGFYKSGSGALILENTILAHSSGAGLQLEGTTGVFTSAGNTFFNNIQGIRVAINTSFQHDNTSTFTGNDYDVYLNGGTVTKEVFWYLNPAYAMYLSDGITVAEGAVLHVLPGTVVKAAQHKALFIAGTLKALGERVKPIIFTDWRDDTRGGDANGDGDETVPGPGWWGGIYVPGSGSADMKHGTIAYAGDSTWADSAYRYAGFYKSGSGALILENTRLAHSSGAGLQLEGTTGVFTSAGNTFSNNGQGIRVAINTSFQHDNTSTFTGNDYDVYLNGGTVTKEVFWYLNPAYAMHLSNSITVAEEAVLHVLPGTVVKAAQHKALFIAGTLKALGEGAKPIVFTDWRDDAAGRDANGDGDETGPEPGWWGGIFVYGSGSAVLEYGTIAYAGYSTWADSAYRYAGLYKSGSGDLDLKRSTIRESNGSGLSINNSSGSHNFERNTFTATPIGVHIINQAESLALSGNLIQGNTDFGLKSQSSAQIDARNIWWGHESGPQHAELNPEGQGDTVSNGVLFDPWRTTPSAGEILSPIRSGTLVAGDLLRFSGSVVSVPDATYRWDFSDGRTFSKRVLNLINFPVTGPVAVSYSATPDGSDDPYPDTRNFTVVADTGNLPDLRVTRVDVAGALAVGQPAQINYTVRNVGKGPAGLSWKDALYLSRDVFLDITDVFLGSVAVNRNLSAGQSYQNTVNATLPAVDEGTYNLIIVANDEWQILELHRPNNEYAAQITAQVPVLKDGEAQTIRYTAGQLEQYFQLTATAGRNLVLDLTNVPQGPEVFIRFGAQPTPGEYDYRLQGGERFVIPAPPAGQWYILVYGSMEQDGEYVMQFDMANVALTGISPSRHGTGSDLELRLAGAGFAYPLNVELVSGKGTIYRADEVEVDSFSQATAAFSAGTVPAGIYAVRVSRDGHTTQLPDALEIVTGGQPKLEVNLILPSRFGYHQLATVYVEYRNTGDAPMPAPLLMVTALQKNRQAAILTLDQSRLSSGFWTSAMPEGFADSVQFLASGSITGILQAGESRRMPVYYAGWQRPWDFSYPPFEWLVGVLDSENDTVIDWAALKDGTRPEYVAEDAWDRVWNNFTALSGNTWGDYVAKLSRNAAYLYRHGQRIEDITALQAFTFRQAEGFSPIVELAGGVDAVVQAPGLPIGFKRSYLHQISRRFGLGPLGRGWTHNWQFALQAEEDETVRITDPSGTPRIFQPDSRYTGRFLAQAGDGGDLRTATGGYRLTEQDGMIRFFSAAGKLIFLEDTNGNRITCTYNADQLSSLTHSSGPVMTLDYNGEGRIASVADHHGRQTRYTYAGEYLSSIRKYDGRTTTYSYNTAAGASQHAIIKIDLPDGNPLTYTYDDRGRLSSVYRNDGKEKVRFFHSGIGRVDMTNALDQTSRFFFDHWGRLFKTENELGEAVQKTFDKLGNLAGVTDPDGFRSDFAYDRQGNLIAATDVMRRVTRFAYTREFNRLASVTDASNNTTAYGYDDRGNLTDKTYPDGNRENLAYDAQGNPASWSNRRGATVTFGYDDAGRITRRDFADGSSAVYRYDARGNLVTAENGQGKTAFTYNENDYLTSVAYPGDRRLDFEYDDVGRRTSSEDQLGHRVTYHYDDDGRFSRLSNDSGDIVTYDYDELGRPARKTMGNGVYTTYSYDPVGRLIEMVNYGSGSDVLSSFAYTYDRRGRRTAMQTRYGVWAYGYDDVGQLIRAVLQSTDPDIPDQNITYEYDVLGNRLRSLVNGQDDTYDTNNLNQYTRAGDSAYTYDPDGNLIREEGPDGVTVYTYNDQNRLIGITHGGDTWQYAYDALGNRVAVDENGAVTHFVHDPIGLGSVVGEYDNAGNLLARNTYGTGLVGRAVAGGMDHYNTFDPMGNTSEVSSAQGELQNRYAYRPFGETILAGQTKDNPFRFMGEFGVMTAPAGLHDVRARHYNARVGRFTAMDPIGFLGGDLNLYRYAMNSPTDGVDPSGLWTRKQCAQWRGGVDMVGGAGGIVIGMITMTGGAAATATGAGAPVGVPTAAAGASAIGWGALNMFYGAAQVLTGKPMPRFGDLSMQIIKELNVLSGKNVKRAESAKELISLLQLSNLVDVGVYVAEKGLGKVDLWCPYNRMPVRIFGACKVSRSPSASRTTQDVGTTRQVSATSDCIPFTLVVFGEAGLAASHDPNQKLGPTGIWDANFLPTGSILSYRIDFENLETATAPAQVVTIRDPLSAHLDLTTFELTQIGFGDVLVDVPAGSKSLDIFVDYPYKDGDYDFMIEVHIEAWLENGVFHVNFISIDPETGLPPQDVGIGFLPPENKTGRGQGFVSCTIKAKPDLPSGTEIRNVADIQFDFGLTIATNQVDPEDPSQGTDPDKEALVTLDSTAPASQVAALPETGMNRIFTISWSGEDDAQGSGVGTYEIYVSTDGGEFTHWLTTAETSAVFYGECGHQYAFYSLAVDNTGNVQSRPEGPYVTTELLPIMGDADGSGAVDLADLIRALKVLSYTVTAPSTLDSCPDVDGGLGMEEAIYILQHLSFEMEQADEENAVLE